MTPVSEFSEPSNLKAWRVECNEIRVDCDVNAAIMNVLQFSGHLNWIDP